MNLALAGRTAIPAACLSHTLPIFLAHFLPPAFPIPGICVGSVTVLAVLLVICALLLGCHIVRITFTSWT